MNQLLENVQDSDFNAMPAGRVDFFPKVAEHVDVVVLSTSNVDYTIPTDARFLIFSPTDETSFAVKKDATAVYPAGTITDGSGSFLSPAQLDVRGVTTLGIIGSASGYLTIAAYG